MPSREQVDSVRILWYHYQSFLQFVEKESEWINLLLFFKCKSSVFEAFSRRIESGDAKSQKHCKNSLLCFRAIVIFECQLCNMQYIVEQQRGFLGPQESRYGPKIKKGIHAIDESQDHFTCQSIHELGPDSYAWLSKSSSPTGWLPSLTWACGLRCYMIRMQVWQMVCGSRFKARNLFATT